MSKYAGRRVVITGGTSGIGLATARLLVSEEAQVLLTGRTKETLDAARREFGENAIVVQSDAASLGDIETLAKLVQSDFAPIDALFVNAGQTRFAAFEEMTEGAYDDADTGSTARGLGRAPSRTSHAAKAGRSRLTSSANRSRNTLAFGDGSLLRSISAGESSTAHEDYLSGQPTGIIRS